MIPITLEDRNEVIWEKCKFFVDKNITIIRGRAKKFLPYTGSAYAIDDFLQEAYICARKAVNDCPAKCSNCETKILECETYPHIFWMVVKNHFSKMATIPSYKKTSGATESKSPLKNVEYLDNILPVNSADSVSFSEILINRLQKEKKIADLSDKALSLMSGKQRKVWEYKIKYFMTNKEIAKKMNFKATQRVSQLLNEGIRQAIEHLHGNGKK